mmetsp:Transcript_20709/g.44549  ORF Transcript_20709/g.44549 Transcript_20709/m.44549 type:complete len:327 (-) Transcript_20709:218-1198(-)
MVPSTLSMCARKESCAVCHADSSAQSNRIDHAHAYSHTQSSTQQGLRHDLAAPVREWRNYNVQQEQNAQCVEPQVVRTASREPSGSRKKRWHEEMLARMGEHKPLADQKPIERRIKFAHRTPVQPPKELDPTGTRPGPLTLAPPLPGSGTVSHQWQQGCQRTHPSGRLPPRLYDCKSLPAQWDTPSMRVAAHGQTAGRRGPATAKCTNRARVLAPQCEPQSSPQEYLAAPVPKNTGQITRRDCYTSNRMGTRDTGNLCSQPITALGSLTEMSWQNTPPAPGPQHQSRSTTSCSGSPLFSEHRSSQRRGRPRVSFGSLDAKRVQLLL